MVSLMAGHHGWLIVQGCRMLQLVCAASCAQLVGGMNSFVLALSLACCHFIEPVLTNPACESSPFIFYFVFKQFLSLPFFYVCDVLHLFIFSICICTSFCYNVCKIKTFEVLFQ